MFEENLTDKISKVLGSFTVQDPDTHETYLFIIVKTVDKKTWVYFSSGEASYNLDSITDYETLPFPGKEIIKHSTEFTIKTRAKLGKPIFCLCDLEEFCKKPQVKKTDIEKTFGCEIV